MSEIFRVVKIISDYEIVVNAGSIHGIKKDDELEIFIPGEEITDPETGETLGTLDTIKANIIVKNVYEKMCVCVNSETITRSIFDPLQNLSRTERKKLNVDSTEISGGLNPDRKIRVGDLVRKAKG